MRRKRDLQKFFSWAQGSSSKIVRQYEEKYNRIGKVLDDNPDLLNFADKDLKKLSRPGGSRRGRKATYTSENLFRAIIVHQIEGTALRRTMVLIAHSEFLKSFLRLGNRSAMDRGGKRKGDVGSGRVLATIRRKLGHFTRHDPDK